MNNTHNNTDAIYTDSSSRNKPSILELAGIPAAGKTTLFKSIKANESVEIIDRESILELIKQDYMNKRLPGKNSRFSSVLGKVAADYPDSDYGHRYLLAMYYYTYDLHKRSPDRKIIFDEGFVQHLSSLAFLEELKINEDFKELVRMIQDKYQIEVIYCDADESTALKRIRRRNRVDRYSSIEDDTYLKDALTIKKQNIKSVLEFFKPYRTVNLNGSIKEAADRFVSGNFPAENNSFIE